MLICKSPEKLEEYQDKHNRYSIDGLPGLIFSRKRAGNSLGLDEVKRWGTRVWKGKLDAVFLGWLIGVIIAIINEVVNRYGETITRNISAAINKSG